MTAATCFAITATTGFASRTDDTPIIRAGHAAWFPVTDVWCVAELASGDPQFRAPGVFCSSERRPYTTVSISILARRIVVMKPPNNRVVFSTKR